MLPSDKEIILKKVLKEISDTRGKSLFHVAVFLLYTVFFYPKYDTVISQKQYFLYMLLSNVHPILLILKINFIALLTNLMHV